MNVLVVKLVNKLLMNLIGQAYPYVHVQVCLDCKLLDYCKLGSFVELKLFDEGTRPLVHVQFDSLLSLFSLFFYLKIALLPFHSFS